jgi:hypothetical protein
MPCHQPSRPSTVRQIFTHHNVRSALFRRSLPPGLARHAGLPVLAYRTAHPVPLPPLDLPSSPPVPTGDETAGAD